METTVLYAVLADGYINPAGWARMVIAMCRHLDGDGDDNDE